MLFLANYEPNVKATIAFLKLLKVKVNDATVDEMLQSHPDWPSLLCISDTLKKWQIPNAAGRIDKNDIDQLPVPFMAPTNITESPLAIVTDVSGDVVTCMSRDYSSNGVRVAKDIFFSSWDGVYLFAEPESQSGEKEYAKKRRKRMLNNVLPLLLTCAIIFLLITLLDKSTAGLAVNKLHVYLQFGILLAGVIVTSLLIWYEIDKNNPALKKVCTGFTRGSCDAILSSRQSKIFSWLSWSEAGFFYFGGSLLNIGFAGSNLPYAIVLLSWLSILALPYTIFSIYYQWKVVKQWCLLCLIVQAILVLGAINTLLFNGLTLSAAIPYTYYLSFAFLYSLSALAWYIIKPVLSDFPKAKMQKRELLRLKFNPDIFDTLLKKQRQVMTPADDIGIVLGNPQGEYELLKVCNPYCGPCSLAHPEIEKLLKLNSNIKARIIFTATNDEKDRSKEPAKHLVAIAGKQDEEKTKKALDDWYLAEKKEYNVFAAKYPMNGELQQQDKKIDAMAEWCKKANIQFTPTIFINGYQLPDAYSIGDLQYFLSV